ncbi:hypothetical protein QTP88_011299 [Uroleucon formosanum]
MNSNNNQTNKNNKNNTISPITIARNKNDNTPDQGWTVKNSANNKRNHSTSSASEPPSPSTNKQIDKNPKKKIFVTQNRYLVLSQDENQNHDATPPSNPTTPTIEQIDEIAPIKPPPPVFVKGVADFPELCKKLIEIIGVDNFVCKASADKLKIQTSNSDSYRTLVRYLKEEKAQYHTYQLREDKPLRIVIRNLHPSTPAETIKEELELLSFEVRQTAVCGKPQKKILRYKAPNIPLIKHNGSLTSSDSEKAELFKIHLSEIFLPHPDIFDPDTISLVNRSLNGPPQSSLPIKPFSPNDLKYQIQKYPRKKSPGYDLITAEVVKCLPKRAIVHITHIFNSIIRLSYFPLLWKFSTIIMIHKPNKPADTTSSYRPISLLPFLAKILEKLILKRILPIISDKKVLPDYQFGFRSSHSTTHQLHRVVDAISFSLEKKLFCTAAFLDISQAFDRVWHDGLLHKLKTFLPSPFYLLIKSYLTERTFQIRYGSDTSSIGSISAGVPQGGILSPILYNIFAADQPITPNTSVADYADDKVIISMNDNPFIASSNLQTHLDLMENWYTKWRFKLNHSKSIHTTFTLRPALTPEVTLYGAPIPSSPSVKYLGLTLDKRLTWAHHIREKRLSLNNKFRILKPLVSNKHISLHVKLLIYKTLLKPIWTYGIQLWGSAKKTNLNKIQCFQNIAIRKLINAPPYISNHTLHTDLKLKTIHEEAKHFYKRFHNRLSSHSNPLIKNLSSLSIPGNPPRRLKRKWCRDLLQILI